MFIGSLFKTSSFIVEIFLCFLFSSSSIYSSFVISISFSFIFLTLKSELSSSTILLLISKFASNFKFSSSISLFNFLFNNLIELALEEIFELKV